MMDDRNSQGGAGQPGAVGLEWGPDEDVECRPGLVDRVFSSCRRAELSQSRGPAELRRGRTRGVPRGWVGPS